jgi:hypothetical protein
MGPISKQLQKGFLDIVHGRVKDRFGWLTQVPVGAEAKQPVRV